MTEPRFKIVFDGELMPNVSLEQTQSNLAELFKSSAERIASLFSGSPVVLKRDLGEDEARQYQQALQKAGAKVRLEAEQASLSLADIDGATPQVASDANSMDCPKCGHQQPKASECSACGVIIEKYLARQAAEQATAPGATEAASPYAPPRSQAVVATDEYSDLQLWGVTGRLGRMRYIAWTFVGTLLTLPLFGLAAAFFAVSMTAGFIAIAVAVLAAIPLLVFNIQVTVKRLHDVGWSGWLVLLCLVPIANLVVYVVALFVPGTPGRNQYGAPPPANSTAVVVLFWLWVVAMALYLLLVMGSAMSGLGSY